MTAADLSMVGLTNGPQLGGQPVVAAILRYRDVDAASRWLRGAFGFDEPRLMRGPDGAVSYYAFAMGSNAILACPIGKTVVDDLLVQPEDVGEASTQTCYLTVQDLDAHCARAMAAGARIKVPPQDDGNGGRFYTCHDIEGHLWNFGTQVFGKTPKPASVVVPPPAAIAPEPQKDGWQILPMLGAALAAAVVTAGLVFASGSAGLTSAPAKDASPTVSAARYDEINDQLTRERETRLKAEKSKQEAAQKLAEQQDAATGLRQSLQQITTDLAVLKQAKTAADGELLVTRNLLEKARQDKTAAEASVAEAVRRSKLEAAASKTEPDDKQKSALLDSQRARQEAEIEVTSLRQQLALAKEEALTAKQTVEALETRRTDLESASKEKSQAAEQQVAAMAAAEEAKKEAQSQLGALRQQLAQAKDETASAKQKTELLETQRAALDKAADEKATATKLLTAALSSAEQSKLDAQQQLVTLRQQLAQAKDETGTAKQAVATLESRLAEQDKAPKQQQAALAAAEQSKQEDQQQLATLRQQLSQSKDEASAASQAKAALENRLAELDKVPKQQAAALAAAEQSKLATQEQLATLRQQLAQAKDETVAAKQTAAGLESRLADLEKAPKAQAATAERQAAELADAQKAKSDVQAELANLRKQLVQVAQEAETAKQAYDRLEAGRITLEKSASEQSQNIERQKAELSAQERSNLNAQAEMANLRLELAKANADVQDARMSGQETKQALDAAQQQLAGLNAAHLDVQKTDSAPATAANADTLVDCSSMGGQNGTLEAKCKPLASKAPAVAAKRPPPVVKPPPKPAVVKRSAMLPDGEAKSCFNRLMAGEVSWGPDSAWTSSYASLLCAGSHNADATIGCFISRVQQGDAWQLAVLHCKAH